ncbi:thiosulfate sulfurtransferase [Equus quagga]|uniref:thiosulfate sulfurtransferase n=1 Tax=Equus quagga TaxID=89248 RepID=UPI001EE333E8|nr:thiosulfate sulfurtransferase [Equus quagga]
MVWAGRVVVGSGFERANFSSGQGELQGGGEGDSHPRQVTCRAETMVHQVLYRALVSTKWLAESVRAGKLGPGLRVLDASWYSPGTREARKEYLERHVPGASFFDIEECRNAASPYEMMLPSEAGFADYVGRLGISNDTHVVVYDGDDLGSFYAPRVWWMFRVFGHRTVSVLNGGFRNWLKEGHPVTSEPSHPEPAIFKATLDRSLLKTYEQVLENLKSKRFQLVDSRSQGRYLGTEPEPDAVGLEPGHIRGSVNMPFMDFLTEDGFEKSPEELRAMFEAKKVNLEQPLIATCRKGVTACHIALAAYLCGKPDVAIYDGSWSEWFRRAPPETRVSQWKGGKA